MPSPDNSPPELVFNISNILFSLSRKAPIWKNCAVPHPVSVPTGLSCSSETGVWAGWYFDWALETVHAQAPWGATGESLSSRGQIRAIYRHSSDSTSGEAASSPPHLRDSQTVPRLLSPVSGQNAQHQGFSVSSSYWQDATLFNFKLSILSWRMGDWSKMHYRK